jgi:hypothetical protein
MGNPTPAVKSLTAAAPLAEASKTPPNMANKWLWGQLIDFSGGGFANSSGNGLSLLEKSGEFVNPECNGHGAPAQAILTVAAVPARIHARHRRHRRHFTDNTQEAQSAPRKYRENIVSSRKRY